MYVGVNLQSISNKRIINHMAYSSQPAYSDQINMEHLCNIWKMMSKEQKGLQPRSPG